MKEIISFLIQLNELFENEEQKAGIENQRAIYVVAKLFLDVAKVAVVPGTGFGVNNYVRWSYATSMDNIVEGIERLKKFLHAADF